MNIWLCPVKPRSRRTIKSTKLFGVPKRGLKTFIRVQPGDLLVFHVFKPIDGIVAICKVKSEVFEDHRDIWGKERYPQSTNRIYSKLHTKREQTHPT